MQAGRGCPPAVPVDLVQRGDDRSRAAKRSAGITNAGREAQHRPRSARDDYKRARECMGRQPGRGPRRSPVRPPRQAVGHAGRAAAPPRGRPCLTFNKMPAFIRQVVNDARQNKPSVKVHPQDSGADKRVAEIYDGLIRNIETTSDADVAYDTAIEHAVGQGFGFWRINTAYTCDDAFDQDIVIERVSNPFTVYGDPRSTAADSSDWNVAFIITTLSKDEFEREYPDAERRIGSSISPTAPTGSTATMWSLPNIGPARRSRRRSSRCRMAASSTPTSSRPIPEQFAGLEVVGKPREVESYKVTQRLMTGAEVLKTVIGRGSTFPSSRSMAMR
jgi:hypothetical protein